jgi:hypothetical protein
MLGIIVVCLRILGCFDVLNKAIVDIMEMHSEVSGSGAACSEGTWICEMKRGWRL